LNKLIVSVFFLTITLLVSLAACGMLGEKGEEPAGQDNLPLSGVGPFQKEDYHCHTQLVQPFIIPSPGYGQAGEPWVLNEGDLFRLWYEERIADRASIWHASFSLSLHRDSCRKLDVTVEQEPEPVLADAGAPTILYEDGIYRMWYVRNGWTGVGYAESSDGLSWTVVDDAVLTPDCPSILHSQYRWEKGTVGSPSVVVHDGTYRMWYDADIFAFRSIGYAFSTDGISWTKYRDNPVLRPDQPTWEYYHPRRPFTGSVGTPMVIVRKTPVRSLYSMYYTGNLKGLLTAAVDDVDSSIGLAMSTDGIHWTKSSTLGIQLVVGNEVNPILNEKLPISFSEGIEGSSNSYDTIGIVDESEPMVWEGDDVFLMWFHQVDWMNLHLTPILPPDGEGVNDFHSTTGIAMAVNHFPG